MRWAYIILCILFILSISGCTPIKRGITDFFANNHESSEQQTTSADETLNERSDDSSSWEDDMFNRFFSTDADQADSLLSQIIEGIEGQDKAALKELFSTNTVLSVGNIEEEIDALFQFYEGNMVSFKRYGPGSSSSKDGGDYVKEIFASYDVTTTAGMYRMAITFCTIDSTDSGNIGLLSLYIIAAEDTDMNYAYWGDDECVPGITIE